jgi:hypothetical protein
MEAIGFNIATNINRTLKLRHYIVPEFVMPKRLYWKFEATAATVYLVERVENLRYPRKA